MMVRMSKMVRMTIKLMLIIRRGVMMWMVVRMLIMVRLTIMLMLIRADTHLQQTFLTVPPLICSSSGQDLTYDIDGD